MVIRARTHTHTRTHIHTHTHTLAQIWVYPPLGVAWSHSPKPHARRWVQSFLAGVPTLMLGGRDEAGILREVGGGLVCVRARACACVYVCVCAHTHAHASAITHVCRV